MADLLASFVAHGMSLVIPEGYYPRLLPMILAVPAVPEALDLATAIAR